jgi:hypothetical protein
MDSELNQHHLLLQQEGCPSPHELPVGLQPLVSWQEHFDLSFRQKQGLEERASKQGEIREQEGLSQFPIWD